MMENGPHLIKENRMLLGLSYHENMCLSKNFSVTDAGRVGGYEDLLIMKSDQTIHQTMNLRADAKFNPADFNLASALCNFKFKNNVQRPF